MRDAAGTTGRRVPLLLVVPAAAAVLFLLVPLAGLLIKAPWPRFVDKIASPGVGQALGLSLVTATETTLVCLLIGIPLAWVLARTRLPGRRLLRVLVTVPLILPPVVGGVALYSALGRQGVLGRWLYDWWGVSIPFTHLAVVLAQTFVALPFLILSVDGALRSSRGELEEASATLGADRWTTFRRVTLPQIGPAVGAGAVLAWARALGEFGATITFAGSLPGRTETMPVRVYTELIDDYDGTIVLSLLLLAVAVIVLIALRGRWVQGLS
ncbi:ABC transporter permease [Cumulibacter manganitolerans]|uniref:ABC transporter permease n=1 Tax=Cumulibacter manganitolerans TaxID=1884992 RepID=UPI001294B781|nr:ABC transporter permease [Cumulibacter manganitolerans]